MKYVSLLAFLFLIGCTKETTKPVKLIDTDFFYADLVAGVQTPVDEQLNLRVMVMQNRSFENRLEQINWALAVTDYSLDLEKSVADFKSLPPSPYLAFNKLISVKHYLRLSGFNGQRIVVDSENKSIVYLSDDHSYFNNLNYFNPVVHVEPISITNDIESSLVIDSLDTDQTNIDSANQIVHIEAHQSSIEAPLTDVPEKNIKEILEPLTVVTPVTDEVEPNDGLTDSHTESISLTVDLNSVINTPEPSLFKVAGNVSLRNIFSDMASFYGLDFISSLGRKDWFLNSTINHDFEFESLDHALLLILAESNDVLVNNNLDFLIKASVHNGILDIYYEN